MSYNTFSAEHIWTKQTCISILAFLDPEALQVHLDSLSTTTETSPFYMDNRIPDQGPILLTWLSVNPSMDKKLHSLWKMEWNYFYIPKHL